MNLYALLIGINDYPTKPLRQCVNDVEKIEAYLLGLESHYDAVDVVSLKNANATKDNVIEQIRTHLGKATDDDVALLYYSGHGAQEETAGLFPEEQDGLIECMVCYSADILSTDQMLADQEIRYLFHQLPANPHLVTAIDACHSGDIVRAFHPEQLDSDDAIKRITGMFPARDYSDFVFAGDAAIGQDAGDGLKVFIPSGCRLSQEL